MSVCKTMVMWILTRHFLLIGEETVSPQILFTHDKLGERQILMSVHEFLPPKNLTIKLLTTNYFKIK